MLDVLKIAVCILLCLKTLKCCDCNLNEMIKDTNVKGSSNVMGKRQMQGEEEDDGIGSNGWITGDSDSVERITIEGKDDNTKVKKESFNATKNTTEKTTKESFDKKVEETTEFAKKNDKCFFYKDGPESNFENMADDVWKIAFYKASEKLACFKIYIKKTSIPYRRKYYEVFGDFNGTVDWKNCQFEVASSALKNGKRHFLQGTAKDRGVFKNVIVKREDNGDVTLIEQSNDQWLVIKNLLLMRDCDNGDIMVFSRLPIEPSLRDIKDALAIFGEDSNGTLACQTLRDLKYETLS